MNRKPSLLRLLAAALSVALAMIGWTALPAAAAAGPNLAAGRPVAVSSTTDVYGGGNATDGNPSTYWESANNAFPQWIQVDLGAPAAVNELALKLPSFWETRTQTLSVQGSTDGSSFTTLSASAARTFNPAATITFAGATVRYVRLTITANTGWPAGQLSEFEVYGPGTGDPQPPTAPGNLAYTEPATGQIKLTWTASTDNVGVTGYDVYANNTLRGSVAGNVLTYTDNQPGSATVSYYVKAKDAAGNQSPASNTVTRTGSGGGANLAAGKPVTASSYVHTYVAANANDNSVTTYWEGAGGSYPNTLTVELGANADVSSIVVKLDPASVWSARTQTFQVLGREQGASGFTNVASSAAYRFDPATGNAVTIPVSARVADVRLSFTANTGAPAGQVAELQVIGVPAPNPDLTVTSVSWSPQSPVETDAITLSAVVRNAGSAPAAASTLAFSVGGNKAGTANVGTLAAGAATTVTANIGTKDAGSYPVTAKADDGGTVVEQDETNNTFTGTSPLVVKQVDSSDLVAAPVSWTPGNPANGSTVTFAVAIKNQGTVASAAGAHPITLTVANESGTVVRTLTGSFSGTIAAGATASPVTLGTWTAANGRYTVKTVIADDGNELPVKRANNTSTQQLYVGRGANLPYDTYEAEDGVTGGGAQVAGPSRDIGTIAGEASGRRAVTLGQTGAYVEWTTKADTNTLVTRFSIPDGTNSTLNIYVDGSFLKAVDLTSKYAWLYGPEASPNNSPGSGAPRHIYDEANVMLGTTVPKGSRIRLQKDPANTTTYA
ncbi:MAG: glycosyl hydrolase, partial [Nonomuraea sp.]|nr:glycosyl hydrolase [Nonomuraea sp.]